MYRIQEITYQHKSQAPHIDLINFDARNQHIELFKLNPEKQKYFLSEIDTNDPILNFYMNQSVYDQAQGDQTLSPNNNNNDNNSQDSDEHDTLRDSSVTLRPDRSSSRPMRRSTRASANIDQNITFSALGTGGTNANAETQSSEDRSASIASNLQNQGQIRLTDYFSRIRESIANRYTTLLTSNPEMSFRDIRSLAINSALEDLDLNLNRNTRGRESDQNRDRLNDHSSNPSDASSSSSTSTTEFFTDREEQDAGSDEASDSTETSSNTPDIVSSDDTGPYNLNRDHYNWQVSNRSNRRRSTIQETEFRLKYTENFYKQPKIPLKLNAIDIPEPRSGHQSVIDGQYLYVFGGYASDKYSEGLFELDDSQTETNRIQEKDYHTMQSNRLHRSRQIDSVYHHLYNEIWRLNLETYIWERLPGKVNLKEASGCLNLYNSPQVSKTTLKNTFIYSGGTGYPFTEATKSIIALEISKNLAAQENFSFKYSTIAKLPIKTYLHSTTLDRQNNILYWSLRVEGFYLLSSEFYRPGLQVLELWLDTLILILDL